MPRFHSVLLPLALIGALAGAPALAQAPPAQTVLQACRTDFQKFCQNSNRKTMRGCLREHRRELSVDCKQALREARAKARAAKLGPTSNER